ncbi:MAG: FtsX-like permease family protein, partial [Actinomycetota bacterium]
YTLYEPSVSIATSPVAGMFDLQSGRAPRAAGEVALSPDLLGALGTRVGATTTLDGLRLRVVGSVLGANPGIAVVGAGTLAQPGAAASGSESPEILVSVPGGISYLAIPAIEQAANGTVFLRSDVMSQEAQSQTHYDEDAFLVATLGLVGMSLIAGAALLVGANRQLRTLGLLAAAGGGRADVAATVVLGGTLLGLAASTIGAALGIAVATAAHPLLTHWTKTITGPLVVRPAPLLGAIGLGTLAATAAAALPARAAARIPVLQALTGRAPAPPPAWRTAGVGVVLAGVGASGMVVGLSSHLPALVGIAAGAMVFGCLLAIPLLVSLAGRIARVLPTNARLAVRDMSRFGRRTGAAVAAATIALALPVVASCYAGSQNAYQRANPQLGPDQLLLSGPDPATQGTVEAKLRRAFPGAELAPMVPSDGGASAVVPGSNVTTGSGLTIGTPDLLRALHAGQAIPALEQGEVIELGPSRIGAVTEGPKTRRILMMAAHVVVSKEPPLGIAPSPTQGTTLPGYEVVIPRYPSMLPRFVVSAQTASQLGISTLPADQGGQGQVLVTTPQPISGAGLARARQIAGGNGFLTSEADAMASGSLIHEMWLCATALALLIVAVAVALVAAESRRNQAIVVAVGANPFAQRRMAAVRAASIALLAAVVAVPAGLFPYAVGQWAEVGGNPVVIPWTALALVVIAVPLIAGLGGGVLSRSPAPGSLLGMLRPAE